MSTSPGCLLRRVLRKSAQKQKVRPWRVLWLEWLRPAVLVRARVPVRLQPLAQAIAAQYGPLAARALAEPLRDAGYLLLASNGKDIVAIARGGFREAPAGATLVAPGLAVTGSPDSVQAAIAQHKAGRNGAPDLLAHAASFADSRQIWMVARGGVPLPVTGNAANLNRLLRDTEYAGIAVRLGSGIEIEATAVGRTAESGREFEENLRAILSLTAAASARQPDVVALIRSVQIRREDRTVRASLSGGPDAADRLLRFVPR